MILGSGCLNDDDDSNGLVLLEPFSIQALLDEWPVLADGISPGEFARSFAESLIKDRLKDRLPRRSEMREYRVQDPGSQGQLSDDEYSARLVLATALLTSLYHELEVIRPQAIRRWGDDIVSLEPGPQRLVELRTLRVEPLLHLLNELKVFGHQAVRKLLGDIERGIVLDKQIKRSNVQILTECAWHSLVDKSAEYPGWSDLLMFLSQKQGEFSSQDRGRPRPSFANPWQVPELIEERYLETSEQSWQERQSGTPSARIQFYDSVARMLRAQSVLRTNTVEVLRPPVVSAFVTSFDLELEMALVSADVPEFIVALPINLYRGPDNEVASFRWIGARIKRSEVHSLEDLRRPSAWMVLSNMWWSDDASYANVPFVVRLTGCPMFHLPRLSDVESPGDLVIDRKAFFRLSDGPTGETLELGHAVLLDEYAAMQQHSTDAFYFVSGGEAGSTLYYGLPKQLTGVPDAGTHARFWMVMGVQMGDSSVRYRVASRFGPDTRTVERRRPERAGVVVTSRIDVAERDLLDWYGFDIVLDHCGLYRGDFDHYVRHLESPDQRTRFNAECPLAMG
jgi:hypothetical protein